MPSTAGHGIWGRAEVGPSLKRDLTVGQPPLPVAVHEVEQLNGFDLRRSMAAGDTRPLIRRSSMLTNIYPEAGLIPQTSMHGRNSVMSEQSDLRESVRAGYAAAALKVIDGGTA
jgi:hypothetical protein